MQTKQLLADLQQKDAMLAEKEAEVDQLRQQGGYHNSSSSDVSNFRRMLSYVCMCEL